MRLNKFKCFTMLLYFITSENLHTYKCEIKNKWIREFNMIYEYIKFSRFLNHIENYITLIANTEFLNPCLSLQARCFFIYKHIHGNITFFNPFYQNNAMRLHKKIYIILKMHSESNFKIKLKKNLFEKCI